MKSEAARALDLTDRKSLLTLQRVGLKSELQRDRGAITPPHAHKYGEHPIESRAFRLI